LVISVDTSIAHLAGAIGAPVWILLPWNADWRWMTDRADTPWYASARLFRQSAESDWDAVVRDVLRELKT
jgi:ADP-heptose:LPS heptosyltransferase